MLTSAGDDPFTDIMKSQRWRFASYPTTSTSAEQHSDEASSARFGSLSPPGWDGLRRLNCKVNPILFNTMRKE